MQTLWLIFQNNYLLVQKNSDESIFIPNDMVETLHWDFFSRHKINTTDGTFINCAEISPLINLPENIEALSLRKALEKFESHYYGLLTRAYAIISWDKNHQFCGRCGHQTQQKFDVFERVCPNCLLVFYPRISPSVIVRITKGNEILMARGHHFLPGVYGLIAGFIEAGENVEEAIHREVKEEVGITIKNLRYFCSQQWPFPDSLMLGFVADYASGEIHIDPTEIEAADWYHYNHLPGKPSSGISIASKLIQDFIQQKQHKNLI